VTETKSFAIPKRLVWGAYLRVKANDGAPGVDGQTMEDFERDLKDNLYRIWNRMSSGTYFPPPVKQVSIPKRDGGKRMLGIPTISDRIAQTVVKMYLEPIVEPQFHPDSYGLWVRREDAAGASPGFSILISGHSSIRLITVL
jgi:RNA-directed DNA polymerase